MNLRNRAYWKQKAQEKLQAASFDPKKLTLFHGAVIVGLSLLLSLISIAINAGIADTSGLGGIQNRNLLQTVMAMLNMAYSIAQPFWVVGLTFAFICIVRNRYADRQTLLRGFYRLGPVLRLNLLKYGLYLLLAFPCAYIASSLAMSISSDLIVLLKPIVAEMADNPNADVYAMIEQLPTGEFLRAMAPLLIVFTVLYVAVIAYLNYRLYCAGYLIVDDPRMGAIAAMKESFRLTKGNCISLFLLDLSFWWYHALTIVAALVAFANELLPYMGIELPISHEWSTVICYCIYGAIILALDYTVRPQVEATYALVYDALRNPQSGLMRGENQ